MDDLARFERRAAELGLARTQGLPVDATITARTLALDEVAPNTVPDLPRISVDGREGTALPSPSGSARRDYTIMATIGEGGMGRVQLARQRSLDRDVALKTLKPGAGPAVAQALLREARLTGALEHPGVIPVHALGVDDQGRPMLVMKRVDGVDLSVLLRDRQHAAWHGRSDNRLVASLEILTQVCLTVEFAHSRGVIHRDIKPENIMVGGFGEVYLLDWGIATTVGEADSRTLVGTPAYLAPEMVLGEAVGTHTDVFLLGATLHEMLTGKPRHAGTTVIDVLREAARCAPFVYEASVPEALAQLCNRATSREPAQRSGVAELRQALGDFLRHRGARALCDAAVERLDSLEKLLTGVPDLPQAYRLVTEARFGLVQSLRENPSDDAARRAMQRCLGLAIDLELRQGHADTADALLREMDAPDEKLQQRIADSRAATAERARERQRLEALERDFDPSEKSGERSRQLVLTTLVLGCISVVMIVRGGAPTPLVSLVAGCVSFTLVGLAMIFLWGRVMTNAFNRRLSVSLLLATGAVLGHRLINYVEPSPVHKMVAIDLLILGSVGLAVALTMLPRLWVVSLPVLLGSAASLAWPSQAPLVLGVSTALAMLLTALLLPRTKTDRRST